MDTAHPPDAWKRLGKALELRRGELGYGYRQRGRFARERGASLSEKTLARLERGERPDSYPDSTLAAAERMYGWAPGSIPRVLSGGEPVLVENVTAEGQPPLHYDDPRIQSVVDATPELDYADRRALAEFTRILIERADAIRRDLSA